MALSHGYRCALAWVAIALCTTLAACASTDDPADKASVGSEDLVIDRGGNMDK